MGCSKSHPLPTPYLSASGGTSSSAVRTRWLKDLFDVADKDCSGTLTMEEVRDLMNELNVGISKKVIANMFKVRTSVN